jgi:NodT family efflux transporter outer membrane factor (OMF) lipoprotein
MKMLINRVFMNKARVLGSRSVLLALLVAGLVSCAVGPDFKKPEVPKIDSFTRETPDSQGGQANAIEADWWRAYGSPQLSELVDLALKNNPNIDAAIANLKIAQQNVIAQQGFFFPQIGAGYVASRQNVGATLAPAINGTASVYGLQTAALSVGFTPDIFGGNRRQVESLKAIANAQQLQLDALRITIATNVIATAVQEAVYREQLQMAKESVEAARIQLGHSQKMAQLGYISGIDLANQESGYAQMAAQVPALKKLREQTLDMLAVLCGQAPNKQLLLPNLDSIHIPEKLPSALPSTLVEQRPDVKIAEELVRASNAQIGVAISNMIPQFSITGVLGGSATAFSEMFNGANNIWGVAGGVGQPLFAGGSLFARKAAAEAGLEASLAQYRSTVITAFQNVADTLYAIDSDGKLYQLARDSEMANGKVYEKTKIQFEKGYTSEPSLLSVKQQYLQAKINAIQAYSVYIGDTAALYQSLGGGWRDESKADMASGAQSSAKPASSFSSK